MQNNSNPTQCDMILDYLKDFGEITQLDALKDLGIMRLASRVSELKRKGYAIKTTMRTAKNRYNKPKLLIELAKIHFGLQDEAHSW